MSSETASLSSPSLPGADPISAARVLPLPRSPAHSIREPFRKPFDPTPWGLSQLAGRLIEISGTAGAGVLSVALGLLADAQQQEDRYGLAAWVAGSGSLFFPPDAVRMGVALERLLVVRVMTAAAQTRAASTLAGSGAFGLIVLDLADPEPPRAPNDSPSPACAVPSRSTSGRRRLPPAPLARLAGLARKYGAAVVILTRKSPEAPSLGPFVLGRYHASHRRGGLAITVLKDNGSGVRSRSPLPPGFRVEKKCDVPAGMSGMC